MFINRQFGVIINKQKLAGNIGKIRIVDGGMKNAVLVAVSADAGCNFVLIIRLVVVAGFP